MMFYAGVGSRETPEHIRSLMEEIAVKLCGEGWILRSGHAKGADQAFERGADGRAEIFLPWYGYNCNEYVTGSIPVLGEIFFEPLPAAFEIAAAHHPRWPLCGSGARKMHARNAHQILGPKLDDPASFVICWTLRAAYRGGTATAIRIAEHYSVPVTNLGDEKGEEMARAWLAGEAAML